MARRRRNGSLLQRSKGLAGRDRELWGSRHRCGVARARGRDGPALAEQACSYAAFVFRAGAG